MTNYKLTIELVPKTSWFDNVRSAVTKSQWDDVRKQVYQQASHKCEICGDVGAKHPVECHEIWNYDDIKLIQKLDGMIALCPNCHMVKHIGLAEIQGKLNKAILHLKKVNKISKREAEEYVTASFALWAKRSCHQWKVDLSYLSKYNIIINKLNKHAKQQ